MPDTVVITGPTVPGQPPVFQVTLLSGIVLTSSAQFPAEPVPLLPLAGENGEILRTP